MENMLLLVMSLALAIGGFFNVFFVLVSNCNIILNWLTFSNSKDIGKEEERDSEAVSLIASSATLFLCDLGASLQKKSLCLFSLKGGY